MRDATVGVIGLGHRVPEQIRRNNDPIFDWLKKNVKDWDELFYGYEERHILSPGETVLDILEPASRMAIADAELAASDIDVVIGCVTPGTYVVPSDLFDLTRRLGLSERTLTLSLNNDFSNFTTAIVMAEALVRAGRAHNVLVAVGAGWSRAVDYRTPQSVSAADGAGAAVIGLATGSRRPRWTIVDQEVIAQEQNFGQMTLIGEKRATVQPGGPGDPSTPDPQASSYSAPFFQITDAGLTSFQTFGAMTAPLAVQRVLARQGISASEITLTGHQASMKLFAKWEELLKPAAVFQTIATLANMTAASIAVNLALMDGQVTTPYLVALTLAPDMHAHALLLKRAQ